MTRALLLFEVGGHNYAIDHHAVRALLPLPKLWRPPSLPRVVAGYADIGGRAVPVLALGSILGGAAQTEPGIYSHLILLAARGDRAETALLVDRAETLHRVERRDISKAAEHDSLNGCVEGEVEIDGRLFHILDPEKLLLAQEKAALAELGEEAERRMAEWGSTIEDPGAATRS
jgi:purine-binding chemotaxis protein CheW